MHHGPIRKLRGQDFPLMVANIYSQAACVGVRDHIPRKFRQALCGELGGSLHIGKLKTYVVADELIIVARIEKIMWQINLLRC
jgi:hypothetical protein